MSKKIYSLVALLVLAAVPAWAQTVTHPALSAGKTTTSCLQLPQGYTQAATVRAPDDISAVTTIEKPTALVRSTAAATKSVTSVSDLAGSYVMTYSTLVSSGYDGGNAVTIEAISGTDSIQINNFYATGNPIKAYVDIDSMKIYIPNQVIGYTSYYGYYDISACDSGVTIYRNQNIEGEISADGTITITSDWGIFITSGTYMNYYYGVYAGALIEPANATMSYDYVGYGYSSSGTESFGVIVEQTARNVLSVKNFADLGGTVEIVLSRDSTATIDRQLVYTNYYGEWYNYTVTYDSYYTDITSYATPIDCDQATDARTISWGKWGVICPTDLSFMGFWVNGKIETEFDITYPVLTVTEFTGDGTEDSPYLIKTLDDLLLLADKVNYDTNYDYSSGSSTWARVFLGKYFSMENDIDMESYRFTPIGNEFSQCFAGTFNGNNHTITGLNINNGTGDYAALFGFCDTTCVIKNLKVDSPVVSSSGYFVAAIAGWHDGTIDNCHVTGATITASEYYGSGGVVAVGTTVTNCTVTSSTVVGTGGYVGGVAGYVWSEISDCSATDMDITAGSYSYNYPAGGVTSYLDNATATRCYFSGYLDGSSSGAHAIGGVVGRCYNGTVSQCYNTGVVKGISTSTSIGGVVGNLYGTVENCYNTGYVGTGSSVETVGGLVGKISTSGSVVRNSYSAGQLIGKSTDYDTSTEIRELVGYVESDVSATIENLYFDKQMANFQSQQYGYYTADLIAGTALTGLDTAVWTYAEGYYPRLVGMDTTAAAMLSASVIVMPQNCSVDKLSDGAKLNLLGSTVAYFTVDGEETSTGIYATIDGDSLKIGSQYGSETLYLACGTAGSKYFVLSVNPIDLNGSGTESDPYLIENKDDLMELATAVNGNSQYFAGNYFLITADIDLENDTSFTGLYQWEGTLDGGGHTIHNMTLPARVVWTTSPEDAEDGLGTPNTSSSQGYSGFIARLAASGTLKNLNIAADCVVLEQWSYASPLVGYNLGTIDSCSNYADAIAYQQYLGGIVGYNDATGVVTNCYNEGAITTSYAAIGGIVGANVGLVQQCQNAGDITIKRMSTYGDDIYLRYSGGITGYTAKGRIVDCVNAGTVTGNIYCGGITGGFHINISSGTLYTNDLINCINYGSVFSADATSTGAIGGYTFYYSTSTGTIENVYYDGQITVHGAFESSSMAGITAATTSTLTSGTALDGYSTDVWQFTAGQYPVLKQFADETRTSALRKVIITVADGETVANLASSATLSADNGCTWTIASGTQFKIEDGKLIPPTEVTTEVIDTLYGTVNSVTKPILVRAIQDIPLSGDGTEESPYLIPTATDWNALAEYIATSTDDLSGKYLMITADLDFSTDGIIPLSYDGITAFDGYLDGNGKTLSGIADTATSTYYGPMAYTTGQSALIHDLTVEGSVTSDYQYTGGLVGTLAGTLENVTSKMTVTSTAIYTGGLVGYVSATAFIKSSVNQGTVTYTGTAAAAYIGGVAGYGANGATYESSGNKGTVSYSGTGSSGSSYIAGLVGYCYPGNFNYCYNEGTVQTTNDGVGGLCGLVGYLQATSSTTGQFSFVGCYNAGDITSSYNNAGLLLSGATYAKVTMDSCYNTGNITSTYTSTKSSSYTAGLSCYYVMGSTYTDCWNAGAITAVGTAYTGGLFGYSRGTGSTSKTVTVSRCYNTGNVTSESTHVGGIVAYHNSYTAIDSCYNTGSIAGTYYCGGISGYVNSATSTSISSCYNAGNVTAKNRAGGILGYTSYQIPVSSCFNVGDITSTSTTQGTGSSAGYAIGGIAGYGSAEFTDVYSAGTMTGVSCVGGIVGYVVKNKTTIDGAYFCGKIDAPADSCGNIIGMSIVNNGKNWASSNSISSTYYLAANNAANDGRDNSSSALSYAELAKLSMGDNWTAGDDYTYPRLTSLADCDYAKAYAAAVVPADSDSYSSITGTFYVGAIDGVTWTASQPVVDVYGNSVLFNTSYTGTLTMTATAGDVSVATELTCSSTSVGTSQIGTDSRTVVSERYYTPSGLQVAKPLQGAIYIVVRTYSDGTSQAVKEAR